MNTLMPSLGKCKQNAKFREVQTEFKCKMNCNVKNVTFDGSRSTYTIKEAYI